MAKTDRKYSCALLVLVAIIALNVYTITLSGRTTVIQTKEALFYPFIMSNQVYMIYSEWK